jgi:RNA polymerase sigma factor (sigma-70 family)
MNCNFETDVSLLEALRSGDGRRMECVCRTLYAGVGRQIRQWFIAKGATPGQADDWIQDTFVKMLRSLDQFRGDSRFVAWLWMIARNVRIDALRSRGRQPQIESLDDDPEDESQAPKPEVADPGPDPLESTARHQYLECLEQAFKAFAGDYPERAEVIQWVTEGRSVTDIAQLRGKSPGAMREDLSQTRKKLRTYSAHCAEG